MNDIKVLLGEAARRVNSDSTAELRGDSITVTFRNGRSQLVTIQVRNDWLRLESVALGAALVDKLGCEDALRRCWLRNSGTDVANFGLDKRGRITGRTDHPLESLDADEVAFYIQTLARESDSFEYALSGDDRH